MSFLIASFFIFFSSPHSFNNNSFFFSERLLIFTSLFGFYFIWISFIIFSCSLIFHSFFFSHSIFNFYFPSSLCIFHLFFLLILCFHIPSFQLSLVRNTSIISLSRNHSKITFPRLAFFDAEEKATIWFLWKAIQMWMKFKNWRQSYYH